MVHHFFVNCVQNSNCVQCIPAHAPGPAFISFPGSAAHLLLFSRCRLSKALLWSILLPTQQPPDGSPSVAVQPPVSEHPPTEGKEGEDTDRAKLQNCQRPIERKNETKAIARLYFFVGNNRETGLVSGEKIIVESITLLKNLTAFQKETFMSGHKRLKSKMCQSK